ncbi:cob(I)yrinic acid a,c-diamide adenosyltransferase [Chloroflexota bacterium]
MSNFFTRQGDDGTTGFLGNKRISKSDARIDALGSLDEASAALGMVRASCSDSEIRDLIVEVQRDLYKIMAEVASSAELQAKFHTLGDERIDWLEKHADHFSSQIEIPKEFIIPGGTPSAAVISFARTVIRRAERRLVELDSEGESVNSLLLKYLNRLSSLCFILEVYESKNKGIQPSLCKEDIDN